MRSAAYVLGLAWRRVTRPGSGALLSAAGIAVGAALLAGVYAGTTVAKDRSVAQGVDRLPASGRSVRAVWFGVPAGDAEAQGALDETVRGAFEQTGLGEPAPLVLFRESTIAGHFVGLAAVDGLAPHVLLRSGRLPRACTAERCEVLRLRGAGAIPNVDGLRLVQVGTAVLRSQQLFGDFLAPTDNALADAQLAPALRRAAAYHRPPPAPLLVAEGVAGLAASHVLDRSYRSYSWVWPLGGGVPRGWEIRDLVDDVDRARASLSAASSSFAVTAPQEELLAAAGAATVAGRRLLLVGGEAAALLLAFAVLVGGSMRRDLGAARRRLTWYGARRWQLRLLALVESALVAVLGTFAGFAVGVVAGAAIAGIAGAPAGAVLRESVLSAGGVLLACLVALVAALVVAMTVSTRPSRHGRFGWLDGVALAAVVVAAALLAGGAADEDRLTEDDGSAIGLLLVPGLVAFAAAVAAARLFGPVTRLLARVPQSGIAVRLAAVSLGRGRGVGTIAVAFLVLAFALGLLADGYRSTLARAEVEQAAFRVPLDVLVREDLTRLVPVFDAASLERFARLAPGVRAVPVVRLSASAGRADRVSGVTVLGLPASELPSLTLWRDDWASTSRAELSKLLESPAERALAGIAVPRAATSVALPASRTLLAVRAVVEDPAGRFVLLELERRGGALRAPVPPALHGGRIVAFELVPPRLIERGADAGHALSGTLRLGTPAFPGAGDSAGFRGWRGSGGAAVRMDGADLVVSYVVTPQRDARVRAAQVTDGSPPAVLATPRLASLAGGVGGLLPLRVGGATIPVRVAAVVDRFPGATGDVLVGDDAALATAVNAEAPGVARPNEAWLDVPPAAVPAVERALAKPPFRALESISRRALESDARRDPLAHGTLLALLAGAAIAFVLAVAALLLTVRADVRDDRGELHDLEAQGARPSLLRRVVRARALVVSVASLVAGLATGALLAALVTRMVTVTARAGVAEPPLATSVDLWVIALGCALFALFGGLLVATATRKAFGEHDRPLRAPEAT
jgi:hypothetical protein